MKLSNETLTILKNFVDIEKAFRTDGGNVIRTKNYENTLYAEAVIKENFDVSFCFNDMTVFMNVAENLSKDSELNFTGNTVQFNDNDENGSSEIFCSDPDMVESITAIKNIPEAVASINISSDVLDRIKKSIGFFKDSIITFEGKNGQLNIKIFSKRGSMNNAKNTIALSSYNGSDFSVTIESNCFKIIPGNYKIEVISDEDDTLLKFVNLDQKIFYLMGE